MASAARLSNLTAHLLSGDATTAARATPTAGTPVALRLTARQITAVDIMFGGAPISGVPDAEATATVHACLRAGIRHYDSAPLYGTSEDKLGAALRSATPESVGAAVSFSGSTGLEVGGEPVFIYTKTGRLVRERTGGDSLGWRPAGSGATGAQQWPISGEAPRTITDDFSANGAFLSHGESLQRLAGDLKIDTLRIHDADTVGGPGATQATGALDQALLPQGMLAGLTALKQAGQITHVSLGMNAHLQHRTIVHGDASWKPAVITDFIRAAPPGTFDCKISQSTLAQRHPRGFPLTGGLLVGSLVQYIR